MISCNRNTSFSFLDVSGSEGQKKKKVSKCRNPRKCLCYSSPQKHSVYILFEVDVEQRLFMWNNELNLHSFSDMLGQWYVVFQVIMISEA